MAPEIMKGLGYSYEVDLWSLGICLFEFMCGYLPYGEEAEDPIEIYKEIMDSDDLEFHPSMPEPARNFTKILLSKDPAVRL
jgi:cGMP-dependent protein kinase